MTHRAGAAPIERPDERREPAPRLTSIAWIAPVAVLAVACTSPLLIALLPGDAGPGLLIAERRDKVVLGSWFALAVALAVLGTRLAGRRNGWTTPAGVAWIIGGVAACVVLT